MNYCTRNWTRDVEILSTFSELRHRPKNRQWLNFTYLLHSAWTSTWTANSNPLPPINLAPLWPQQIPLLLNKKKLATNSFAIKNCSQINWIQLFCRCTSYDFLSGVIFIAQRLISAEWENIFARRDLSLAGTATAWVAWKTLRGKWKLFSAFEHRS